MSRYMIAFDDGDMTFPMEELPHVAKAAGAVVREARDAGVWVFGAGLEHQVPSVVGTLVESASMNMPRTFAGHEYVGQ